MKRKLLLAIAVVFGIAATFFMPVVIGALAALACIYMAWMVWKKKTDIFPESLEPELAERRLKRLKIYLLAAGISFAVFIAGVIAHNVSYALSENEEPVSFFIAIVALWVLIIATVGGLAIFVKGRKKPPPAR